MTVSPSSLGDPSVPSVQGPLVSWETRDTFCMEITDVRSIFETRFRVRIAQDLGGKNFRAGIE